MNVDITFKEMESTEAIKALTREKSEKLEKYFQGNTHVTWNFSVEKSEHVARCRLIGNNMDYNVEARTEDLYKSIDEALSKVERQIRKHKEMVTDHQFESRHRVPKAAGE